MEPGSTCPRQEKQGQTGPRALPGREGRRDEKAKEREKESWGGQDEEESETREEKAKASIQTARPDKANGFQTLFV